MHSIISPASWDIQILSNISLNFAIKITIFREVMSYKTSDEYQCFRTHPLHPYSSYPEDRGSRLLRNIGISLLCAQSHTWEQCSSQSQQREPKSHMSHHNRTGTALPISFRQRTLLVLRKVLTEPLIKFLYVKLKIRQQMRKIHK
jgi:hypothetical protein